MGASLLNALRSLGIARDATPAIQRLDGSQEATIVVRRGYRPGRIELLAGIPALLRFDRREDDPCTETLVCELLPTTEHRLAPEAETVIRFTPRRPGRYAFTCGMGMYSGEIVVRAGSRACG